MRALRYAAISSILVFLAASCGRSDTDTSTERSYQLCPKSEDARARLQELAQAYAARHQAQVFDRGAEAQNELASMESELLRSTNLPLVLLTIEKPKVFRISIANAGLKEKFALTIRLWNNSDEHRKAEAFLSQVQRFWSIEKVQGSVLNDPPCPPS